MLCLVPNLDNGGLQRWEKISKLETDVDKFSGFFSPGSRKHFKRPVSENFIHFGLKWMSAKGAPLCNVHNNTFDVNIYSNSLEINI